MKLVTAIVRPEKLDEIIDVVIDNGGRGLTATTVRGFGQQFGERAHRAAEAGPDATRGLPLYRKAVLLTKVRLDILVLDEDAQAMMDAIAKHARTGGDRRREDLGVFPRQRPARADRRAGSRRGLIRDTPDECP